MAQRVKRISAKNSQGVIKYLIEQTVRYYEGKDGGEPPGFFMGKGAEFLGLNAPISKTALERFFRGEDPATGTPLVTRRKDACPAIDILLSTPKSISVLHALTKDAKERKKIDDGITKATHRTIERIERELEYRLGRNGSEVKKVAGALMAVFPHGDTREKDPHKHFHILLANIAWQQDGKTSAISPDRLFELHKLSDAIYQRELAVEMRKLGYGIEERMVKDVRGRNILRTSVAGIPEDIVDLFSKRTNDVKKRVAAIEEQEVDEGNKKVSSVLLDEIGRETKKAKSHINAKSRHSKWQVEAAEKGFVLDTAALKLAAKTLEPPKNKTDAEIVCGLLDKEAVFSRDKLEEVIAMQAVFDPKTDSDPNYVRNRVNGILRSTELLPLINKKGRVVWTTQTIRQSELDYIAYAVSTAGDRTHANQINKNRLEEVFEKQKQDIIARLKQKNGHDWGKSWKQKAFEKQCDAVRHLTLDSGRVALMSGAAGSGKSLSSKMVVQAFEDAGYKVIGASVSWKATRNFESEAGAKSQSVASLVQSIKNGKSPLDAKTVLCIDEHGMCGSADTSIILKEAEKVGAKVILIGESSQLVPISEGSAFASIENALKANGYGLAEDDKIAVLDDIQRQRQAWHRDAVYAMRAGNAEESLSAFETHGLLTTTETKQQAIVKAVDAFIEAKERSNDVLMLAATRADVFELNKQARERLKERGEIGKTEISISVSYGELEGYANSYTIKETRAFSARERVVFKKNDIKGIGVINGDEGTIEKIQKTRDGAELTVKIDGKDGKEGKLITFSTNNYDSMDWCQAISVHSSQGKTVEEVVMLCDPDSGIMTRNLAYVGISRSRGDTKIFTTDVSALAVIASQNAEKSTTLNFALAVGDREELIERTVSNKPVETAIAAITHGTPEQLREMLNREPEALSRTDDHGNGLLHLAIFNGNIEATKILVAMGLNPDQENNHGNTPRSDAERTDDIAVRTAFKLAFQQKTVDMEPSHAEAELSEASTEATTICQEPNPVKPNQPVDQTAIVLPQENTNTMQPTADASPEASPEADNVHEQPPKPAPTVGNTCLKVIEAIRRGIDVNKEIKRLMNRSNGQVREGAAETLLHVATRENCIEGVQVALDNKANVDSINTDENSKFVGDTALHVALREGHTDIVKRLLAAGANTAVPDKDGDTPMEFAKASGDKDLKRAFGIVEPLPKPEPSFAKPPKAAQVYRDAKVRNKNDDYDMEM